MMKPDYKLRAENEVKLRSRIPPSPGHVQKIGAASPPASNLEAVFAGS
jgi:hypothetical protein